MKRESIDKKFGKLKMTLARHEEIRVRIHLEYRELNYSMILKDPLRGHQL